MNAKIVMPVMFVLMLVAMPSGALAQEIAPAPIEHDASVGERNLEEPVIVTNPIEYVTSNGENDPIIAPPPTIPEPVKHENPETDELIGGETDEHGCLGTAGYQWDEEKQVCVRPWNGEIQDRTVETNNDMTGYPEPIAMPYDTNEMIGVENTEIIAPISAEIDPVTAFFRAIVGFFQNLLGF